MCLDLEVCILVDWGADRVRMIRCCAMAGDGGLRVGTMLDQILGDHFVLEDRRGHQRRPAIVRCFVDVYTELLDQASNSGQKPKLSSDTNGVKPLCMD
jgi:hypothetical protein